MVLQVEHFGESGSGEPVLLPTAIRLLRIEQVGNAATHAAARVIAGSEQSHQRRGSLGCRAGASAFARWIVIAAAAFAPSAVGILNGTDPLAGLDDAGFSGIYSGGAKSSQGEARPVDVVDAPASHPTAVWFLNVSQIIDCTPRGGMVRAGEFAGRERLQDAPCDIGAGRVEHGVVVGERHLREDPAVV